MAKNYIKANELCNYLVDHRTCDIFNYANMVNDSIINALLEYIDKLPEPDVVERKKGKWIPGREIAREYSPYHEKRDKYSPNMPCNIIYEDYKCSCCGLSIDRPLYDWKGEPFYKFCPNCGAEMEEIDG